MFYYVEPKREDLEYKLNVVRLVNRYVLSAAFIFWILALYCLLIGWSGWAFAFLVASTYFCIISLLVIVDLHRTVNVLVNLEAKEVN